MPDLGDRQGVHLAKDEWRHGDFKAPNATRDANRSLLGNDSTVGITCCRPAPCSREGALADG